MNFKNSDEGALKLSTYSLECPLPSLNSFESFWQGGRVLEASKSTQLDKSDPISAIQMRGNRAVIWMSSDCFRAVGLYIEHVLVSTEFGAFLKFRKAEKMVDYLTLLGASLVIHQKVVDLVVVVSWKNTKACIEAISQVIVGPMISLVVIVCDNSKSQGNAETWVRTLSEPVYSKILLCLNVETASCALKVWKSVRDV